MAAFTPGRDDALNHKGHMRVRTCPSGFRMELRLGLRLLLRRATLRLNLAGLVVQDHRAGAGNRLYEIKHRGNRVSDRVK